MKKNIYICGDIHGSKLPIESFLSRNKEASFSQTSTVIILLGDAGANFYLNKTDKKFKKFLNTTPFTYFLIRGNHEERSSNLASANPDKWHEEIFFKNTVLVEDEYSNIKYALDMPAIYEIDGYKTLTIPGAYSVDKYFRLKSKWPWFKDEQLTIEEMNLGRKLLEENNYNVDLVLSHTCPSIYEPTDLFLKNIDQSLVDNTMERYLGEIEFKLNYQVWLWGHFHNFRRYPIDKEGRQRIMLSAGQEFLKLEDIFNKEYITY